MYLALTLVSAGEEPVDLVVDLDDQATIADLIDTIKPGIDPNTLLYHGPTRLDADDLVRTSSVKDGSVLHLGVKPPHTGHRPGQSVRVSVIGGVGAGHSWFVDVGSTSFGSGEHNDIVVDWFPEHAFAIHVSMGANISLTPGMSEVLIDGEAHTQATKVLPGAAVTVVDSIVEARPVQVNNLTTALAPDNIGWDIHRPPRLLPADHEAKFTLPTKPKPPKSRSFPVLMLIAPIIMAAVMVMVMKNTMFLMFALFSPVMLLGSWLTTKFGDKKNYKVDLAEFEATTVRIQQDIAESVRTEQSQQRLMAPDPAEISQIATGPGTRLWERRPDDPDFLALRLGVHTMPSGVEVEDPSLDSHKRKTRPDVLDVPVTIALPERGVVGICGHPSYVRTLTAWTVAQIAALHSPRDVSLYVLTSAAHVDQWSWARWLPHLKPTGGQQTMATIGADAQSLARRVGELNQIVQERLAAADSLGRGEVPSPVFVVIFDNYRAMRGTPGVSAVLKDGPAVGVYAICRDTEARYLPEEADAVVAVSSTGRVTVQQQKTADILGARCDLVADDWFAPVSRGLAALRDAGEEDGAGLPTSCRLLDLVELPEPDAQALLTRWATSGRSTSSIIGATTDGSMVIDLVRDGPHALVAGTTGSGKSELLQSWVAGLAAVNRPDELCFVLVDYKGGAAFADCALLPHTVGMVTDLDAHLVARSLTSLGAELRYREEVFASVKAPNIEAYQRLRDADESLTPMPRLLLMIDEFAALAQEFPDFVSGLVDFAQRGRSLGMHLVLATQRPAGVISGPIRANTNLRISLRVTSPSESTDVIESPDAAKISPATPGRGVVFLGSNTYVPFQTARVAGAAPTAAAVVAGWCAPCPIAQVSEPAPKRPKAPESQETKVTDLAIFVQAVQAAADALAIPPGRQPWLAPLPELVTISDLGCTAGTLADPGQAIWGLVDLPDEQLQKPLALDLAEFTHKFVVGAARSGRTQTLRTIAAALATAYSSADVHLYGIDCGNGGLAALTALPHCGFVAPRSNEFLIRQLLDRLTNMVVSRGQTLAAAGVGGLPELRVQLSVGDPNRLPHVVVFLDRWEGWTANFAQLDHGALHDQILQLLSDGPSVGIHLVISGDRHLSSGRMMSLTEDRLVLRLNESGDYQMVGIKSAAVPETMPSGRGITTDELSEVQVGVLATDDTAAAQAEAIRQVAAAVADRDAQVPAAMRPFEIKLLPDVITWDQLTTYPDTTDRRILQPLCGVGGPQISGLGPDLADVGTFTVTGPARSGRSTIVALMTDSLLSAGAKVAVVAPRPSPLRQLADRAGVLGVITDPKVAKQDLIDLVGQEPNTVLVIDDGELLKDTPAALWLNEYVPVVRDFGQGLILAGTTSSLAGGFAGWLTAVRKARSGLLTAQAEMSDGDMLGVRLSRSALSDKPQLGRAWYHDGAGKLLAMAYPQLPDSFGG